MYKIPIATYRLQFHSDFTFAQGKAIAGYLAELGISDIYSSPVLRARRGSRHGYDVVDASTVNPELGGEEQFRDMQSELQRLKLGFILDIVPNHMAASPENGWWVSVLENGPYSRFFQYFDIDWTPVTTRGGKVVNKVMLPILGRPYGEAVESQEIQLGYDENGLHFRYYDRRLPLSPESYLLVLAECVEALPHHGVAMELREIVKPTGTTDLQANFVNSRYLKETLRRLYDGEPSFRKALDETIARINGEPGKSDSFNFVDELLDLQWYRLAYWRIASEKINYRRFFDVADLVGIRVENPEVFEARHKRILQFVADGHVTGLRIDHIDGLYDPIGHLRKAQLRLASGEPSHVPDSEERRADRHFYVVVEKILAHDETLPKEFACSGTTGYDFLDVLDAVFVDPEGLEKIDVFYRDFTGLDASFEQICYERKKQVIQELFSGEMRALGKRLGELSMHDRNARDFAPSELLAALTEITASMSVYRTYIRDLKPSPEDAAFIRRAVARARERAGTALDERLFSFLQCVLLVEPPSYIAAERQRWLAFVMRWQQFTGRVMAKGVEDTAFYNYNRLVSLNEVGGEPGRNPDFDPVEEFHARNERTQRDWPDTMNASSTHDTKRSEDVRCRISVLSEMADVWEKEVRRWNEMNRRYRTGEFPSHNEEYLLYQTLIGMWPLIDDEEADDIPDRLRTYLEKASREAKTHTSWLAPNAEFEKAYFDFALAIMADENFKRTFLRLQRRVAYHGHLNSLSQLVLKLTSPGIPDFYQGTEIWDFSLVDPDNRREVDYEKRSSMLKRLKASATRGALDFSTLLRRWFDGRLKLYVTWRGLELRSRRSDVFRRGEYRRLGASPNLVSFLRGQDVLVAVPRLTSRLVRPNESPVGEVWKNAVLDGVPAGTWKNIFTGDTLAVDGPPPLSQIFARFPVAIWERN
jgi:(1->4)-alpha-D-glucan 1-alpha-D-glucosylmutase